MGRVAIGLVPGRSPFSIVGQIIPESTASGVFVTVVYSIRLTDGFRKGLDAG